MRGQLDGKTWQSVASGGEMQSADHAEESDPNLLPMCSLGDERQDVASAGESAPSWARTMNLLIKSQLLCQLS